MRGSRTASPGTGTTCTGCSTSSRGGISTCEAARQRGLHRNSRAGRERLRPRRAEEKQIRGACPAVAPAKEEREGEGVSVSSRWGWGPSAIEKKEIRSLRCLKCRRYGCPGSTRPVIRSGERSAIPARCVTLPRAAEACSRGLRWRSRQDSPRRSAGFSVRRAARRWPARRDCRCPRCRSRYRLPQAAAARCRELTPADRAAAAGRPAHARDGRRPGRRRAARADGARLAAVRARDTSSVTSRTRAANARARSAQRGSSASS